MIKIMLTKYNSNSNLQNFSNMSKLTKPNPFNSIYSSPLSVLKEVESMFDEVFNVMNVNKEYLNTKYSSILTTDDSIILKYNLAGVKKEDIDIQLSKEWLKIEYKVESNNHTPTNEDTKYHNYTINEFVGNYDFVKDDTKCSYVDGILTVTLVKSKDSLPINLAID